MEKQVEDLASLLQIMLELRGRVDKLETEVRTIQGKEVTDVQQSQPIATDAQNNSAHQASLGNQETHVPSVTCTPNSPSVHDHPASGWPRAC